MKLPSLVSDPFDHSKCGHAQPVFPVQLSPGLAIDLVDVLRTLWLALAAGEVLRAIDFIEDLGRWVEMSSLGHGEAVDAEASLLRATQADLKVLKSDEFDAELRKLLGEPE